MLATILFSISLGVALIFAGLLVLDNLDECFASNLLSGLPKYLKHRSPFRALLEPEALMAISAALISLVIVCLR
jgi:uncharacterized membrane protein YphA (DoxX/SURF4 family)